MKTLPDITDVKELGPSDSALIGEIVDVLKRYDALDRFGLTLLHQHFPISDDEVLVENVDTEHRTQSIHPMKKEDLSSLPYTETSWRLDTSKPVMACVCIKYSDGHQHQSRG
jgi:hypothetical protein